jgi:nucleoid DNA-binding protein
MMTQSQVATHLSDKVGITKKQAKSALEELTTLVVRELKREGSLRLAGLGTRLRFTPAKSLKDSVLGAR